MRRVASIRWGQVGADVGCGTTAVFADDGESWVQSGDWDFTGARGEILGWSSVALSAAAVSKGGRSTSDIRGGGCASDDDQHNCGYDQFSGDSAMSEDDDVESSLLEAYDRGGQRAVYDYVKANHGDWSWSVCIACEDETPTWRTDNTLLCAVCFSVK